VTNIFLKFSQQLVLSSTGSWDKLEGFYYVGQVVANRVMANANRCEGLIPLPFTRF